MCASMFGFVHELFTCVHICVLQLMCVYIYVCISLYMHMYIHKYVCMRGLDQTQCSQGAWRNGAGLTLGLHKADSTRSGGAQSVLI